MGLTEALQIVCLSDIGLVCDNNEDCVTADAALGLVILADGMGGHNAGEVASEMTVNGILHGMQQHWQAEMAGDSAAVARLLQQQITDANNAVFQKAQTDAACAGMGTTVVACQFHNNLLTVGHIGDSRLYRLRNDVLEVITRDHSVLQEQIDAGLLTVEEAWHSPQKNLLTRALGVDEHEEAEMQQIAVEVGDLYLLCSDGLNDMVQDADIELNLSLLQANLDLCAQHLIQAAHDGGGRDNVSLILVRILQDFSDENN